MLANERLDAILDSGHQPSIVRNSRKVLAFLTVLCASGARTMPRMDMAAHMDISYGALCQAMNFLESNDIIEVEKTRNVATAIGVDGNWTQSTELQSNWGDGYVDNPVAAQIGSNRLRDKILDYFKKYDNRIRGALNG